jgi:outer membrane biosynthesis protein TonB
MWTVIKSPDMTRRTYSNRKTNISVIALAILLLFFRGVAIGQQTALTYVEPVAIKKPIVKLPKEAKASGLGGTVRANVAVDSRGIVTSVSDVLGPGPVCRQVTRRDVVMLRDSVRSAAGRTIFRPAVSNGVPVASSTWLDFDFPIPKERKSSGKTANYAAVQDTPVDKAPADTNKYTIKGDIIRSAVSDMPIGKAETISGGVLNGKAVALPRPKYPPAARAVRASGAVAVQVLIEEDGSIFSAQAVNGPPLLRAESVMAACRAKFSPTRLSGKPVKVAGIITYNYVP